jgi:DNA adenine methylase
MHMIIILINLYNLIKTNHEKLYNDIIKIVNIYNSCDILKGDRNAKNIEEAIKSKESYYYWMRNEYNNTTNNIYYKSALFVFLNKTCFRGMYRVGPNGFNVPFGNYKKPTIINKQHLKKVSDLIQNVKFICIDYTKSIKYIKINDFSYLDPPYYPINSKSFVKYNKNVFNLNNHKKLFELCHLLNKKNIKFIISNSYTKYVVNEFIKYKNYNICNITVKRRINSKNPQSTCKEVIISNY